MTMTAVSPPSIYLKTHCLQDLVIPLSKQGKMTLVTAAIQIVWVKDRVDLTG